MNVFVIMFFIYIVLMFALYMCNVFNLSMFVSVTLVYIICCYVLKAYNVIGANKGIKLAEKDKKVYKDDQRKTKLLQWFLSGMEQCGLRLGLPISDVTLFSWEFYIMRVLPPLPYVNRHIKAIELMGICRAVSFIVIFACAQGFLISWSIVYIVVAVLSLMLPNVIRGILKMLIDEQDRELERDFPDLYLLLYCSLMGGVNARIAPALQDFLRSCDALYAPDEHTVIRQFVRDLQNNIEIYADEPTALVHLRDKYKSALVVNFCNTANQALRGVPMEDKLLNFKIELQTQQKTRMEKEARARVERGRKVLVLVYVILFEFILLSWASKLF